MVCIQQMLGEHCYRLEFPPREIVVSESPWVEGVDELPNGELQQGGHGSYAQEWRRDEEHDTLKC